MSGSSMNYSVSHAFDLKGIGEHGITFHEPRGLRYFFLFFFSMAVCSVKPFHTLIELAYCEA